VGHPRDEGDEAVLLAEREGPMDKLRLPVNRRLGGTGDGFGSQARPDPSDTGLLSDRLGVVKSRLDYSESRDN
jgi:hypothetical protein